MFESDVTQAATPRSGGLFNHYSDLESGWRVRDNPDYEALVTPNGNSVTPIHRWFHLKEGFSHRLLGRVLKDTNWNASRPLTIIDPYAGSGTTAISALDLVRSNELTSVAAYGVEVNPFLHLVSSAKLAGALDVDARLLSAHVDVVAAHARDRRRRRADPPLLSTFHRPEYWSSSAAEGLQRLRAAADGVAVGDDGVRLITDLLIAACVEPSSSLRRDGRALRHTPNKQPADPVDEFLRRAELVLSDIEGLTRDRGSGFGVVRHGDARTLDGISPQVRADIAIFSPPYPNNIDYTEVYKLEAWALGLISTQEEFRAQRARTVRSHPSLKWTERYHFVDSSVAPEVQRLLMPLIVAIPATRDRGARKRLVYGYADDMWRTLTSCRMRLKHGGRLIYVVGNSLHGQGDSAWLFAADLIIARLAELAGFRVDSVEVARRPARRQGGGTYLRESVVFLTAI